MARHKEGDLPALIRVGLVCAHQQYGLVLACGLLDLVADMRRARRIPTEQKQEYATLLDRLDDRLRVPLPREHVPRSDPAGDARLLQMSAEDLRQRLILSGV